MRRILLFLGGVFLAASPLSPLRSQSPEKLRDRLKAAAADSSLDDPQLLPWHLKLAVQLFDLKGND